MTAPVWLAAPPEVHSALLSAGPGPGPMLAAAAAWHQLSIQYATAATELTSLLAAVQAGSWEGPSAAQYVAAHGPYLSWLTQQSAQSTAAAASHETVAAAYTTALATMPTLPELALNHTVHAVLVGTNFFGINTIPIALNEADYVRMWIQAAMSMATYQAVSTSAVAGLPAAAPAPPLLKANGVGEAAGNSGQAAAAAQAAEAGEALNEGDIISDLLQYIIDLFPGLDEIIKFLQDPIGNFEKLITDFLTNPEAALVTWGPLLIAVAYQAFTNLVGWPTWGLILSTPFLLPVALGLGIAGLQQIIQLLNPPPLPAAAAPAPAPAPVAAGNAVLPAGFVPPPGPPPPTTPAPSAPIGGGAPAPPAPPAPAAGPGFLYAVHGGDPGEGWGPTLIDRTGAKAPAGDIPAAAAAGAAATAAEKRRARRKRGGQLKDRGFRDEYMDLDSGPDLPPDVHEPLSSASGRGAGPMGFTGATPRADARAAGLSTATSGAFEDEPVSPMLPSTWDPDSERGGDTT